MSGFNMIVYDNDGNVLCPAWPVDETVVEVKLKDGSMRHAWFGCHLMEPGDFDFVPVDDNDEIIEDADSLVDEVVAWRPIQYLTE